LTRSGAALGAKPTRLTKPLLGEAELRSLADLALGSAEGDQAEVLIIAHEEGLTRFARGAIHQNVASREVALRIRVVRGKRAALVSTDRSDREGIERAARDASELARHVPENPNFGGLPAPRPIPPAPVSYAERTAAATPSERARAVARICDPARAQGLGAAGFVSTLAQETAVATSLGAWAYAPQTLAAVEVVAIGDQGTAFAERSHADLARLDIGGAADEAIAKALAAQGPRDLRPGEHEVVLEPYAVADIVGFLGQQLTGVAVEEGRSFVGGRIGEHVTGDLTFVEDPFDPDALPRPFDYEGQPSERVVLIERGTARAVVYDSATAHRTGGRNTGHALPPNPVMPSLPMHLRLEPGDRTRDELIAGVERGVLVTRFWYTRWVHPLRTIVTGMTRDGTFAVERGEVAYPIKNFRFTQSYAGALEGIRGIGRDLHLSAGASGGGLAAVRRVPALRLGSFNFTGATQY
jgi:PmbA protein